MFSSHWWDGPNLPGISVPLTAPGADLRPVGACSRRAIGGWNPSWKRGFWKWKSMNLKRKKKVNNLICYDMLLKKVCDFIPYLLISTYGVFGEYWKGLGLQNGCRCPMVWSLPLLPLDAAGGAGCFSGCPEIEIPWVASVSQWVIEAFNGFNGLVCWGKSTGNHGFYHQI